MKKSLRSCLVVLAVLLVGRSAEASTITVLVGDKDGFGGSQICNPCSPGDPFANLTTPAIAPGTYIGSAGMDATTNSPWNPYIFQFNFAYDASSLSSLTSAFVTIQTGSLSVRDDGTGFGFAPVSGNNGLGPVSLGQFLTVSTGARASSAEESVRNLTFNVLPLLSLTGPTTLSIIINGSQLVNPDDQFTIDWAELTINGVSAPSPVPEPASITLLAIGLLGIARLSRRTHR